MANPVDTVIGSEAIKQVQQLKKELETAVLSMVDLSTEAQKAGKNISGISTPKGFNDSLANNSKLSQELDKQNKIINSLSEQVKKLSQVRAINNKMSAEEAVNQRILNQNALAEAKAVSNLVGAYQKLDLEHKKALKNAQDIGAQYGITSDKFVKASQRANELDVRLKEIDSTLGKNNRYVGEYGRGFNALGNSINQLTREAPAFANSINTGFMAISNNIPALTDAISGIRAQNKALAAEGKPTTSVLSQLGSAFFSWNTLISVGVTLLTVYGGKLIDFIFNTNEAKRATDSLTNSMKLNEEQTNKNIATLEYNNKVAVELAKKRGASEKELRELQKKLGVEMVSEYEKNYNQITNRLRAFDDYRLLQSQGGNKAFMYLLKKFNGDVAKAREEYNRRDIVYTDQNRKILVDSQKKAYDELKKQNDENVLSGLRLRNEETESEKQENKKRLDDFNSIEQERLKNKHARELSDLELEKRNAKQLLDTYRGVAEQRALYSIQLAEIENRITKAKYNEEVRLAQGNSDLLKIAANNQITALEETKTSNLVRIRDFYEEMFLEVEKVADTLKPKDGSEESSDPLLVKMIVGTLEEQNKAVEKAKQYAQKTAEELKNYLNSFGAEFFGNAGFSETFSNLFDLDESGNNFFQQIDDSLLSSEEKFAAYFNGITEMAQEAFNFISNASQQRFDAEKSRLQDQYDVAIGFANGNKAAEEKLANDLEKRKKEIANRENKAKQKQAIFNIAIDTAQAIMGLWAKPGFPAAIPLAIAVGALGAAQIGIVAAQKIPQYAEGTDNHIGGLMLVNDAKGNNYQEKVIFPNGKEFTPEGRNVLMNAPKGTKVLTPEQQLMQALQGTNINLSKETINRANGMTAQQMDAVLGKHFSNIQMNGVSFDVNGMRTWSERSGNKVIRNDVRVSRTGIVV